MSKRKLKADSRLRLHFVGEIGDSLRHASLDGKKLLCNCARRKPLTKGFSCTVKHWLSLNFTCQRCRDILWSRMSREEAKKTRAYVMRWKKDEADTTPGGESDET